MNGAWILRDAMTPEQEWRQLLLGNIKDLHTEIGEVKSELAKVKGEVSEIKSDVNILKLKSAIVGSIIGSIGTYIANKLF